MTDRHSWILEAIEREAEKRAGKIYDLNYLEGYLHIYGLNLKKVWALVQFYETTTGKSAHDLPEDAPRPKIV